MKKNDLENKAVKQKAKKVDLSKLADKVNVIITKGNDKGQEYNVTKEMAIILINKGAAKLK